MKDVKIYIYNVKKNELVLGILDIEEIRDNDNATGLKEEGAIQIKTERDNDNATGLKRGRSNKKNQNYSASIRDARSLFAFCIYTYHVFKTRW